MGIIDALQKLGFSFWQLFLLLLIVFFRKEIKSIISNITSLKFGSSEIHLSSRRELINELKNIKSNLIEDDKLSTNNESIKKIDEVITNKYLGTLLNIKNNTTDLWPKLLDNKNKQNITALARKATYENVYADLFILQEAGFLKFDVSKTFPFDVGHGMININLSEIS